MSDDLERDVSNLRLIDEVYRLAGQPLRHIGVVEVLTDTRFGVLLDEGFTAREIARVVAAGVVTVDGVRTVLTGTPVEWVLAFESGDVLGFVAEVAA